ncbi:MULTISPECIES: ATP-binding protein [Alphaproteobacteria]|uniref:ATP-binding protein n=2 Tax=Pseudomonadota TaxID=1224 RepID=UPI00329A0C8E
MTTISILRSEAMKLLEMSRCDESVLELLRTEEGVFEQEDYLWDYKASLGLEELKPGSINYKSKLCELVKDIAAFHNTFGGFIILGVSDKERRCVGYAGQVPFDDIISRVETDLKRRIHITLKDISTRDGPLAIIHVPQKKPGESPKSFERDAKPSESGKLAYRAGQIYYRDWQSSQVAAGDALVSLIAEAFDVPGIRVHSKIDELTTHNLPARSFDLRNFVGRSEYLERLWMWMLDKFVPMRIVTGIGGLGKTTLVRKFCEDILTKSPGGLQALLWYSAKSVNYNAQLATFEKKRPDDPNFFSSPFDLYRKILGDLGMTEDEISEMETSSDFIPNLIEVLTMTPSLIIVDDLDSLADDDQAQIFRELGIVFTRTSGGILSSSRGILTARQLVGAMPSETVKLQGFERPEFKRFVEELYSMFDLTFNSLSKSPKLLDKFLKVSGGSPLFATSIVRLVYQGMDLDKALNQFKDKQGDEVRRFTFDRELEKLTPSQLRCLFALINLSPCSGLELSQALEVSEDQLSVDLSGLRDFHLLSRHDIGSVRGRELYIESYIQLLRDLVAEKIQDPKRIEKNCKSIRTNKKAKTEDVSKIIGQVLSLWRNEEYDGALEFILNQEAMQSSEAFTGDLHCIAGRAFLRVEPCQWSEAARRFRKAYEEDCQRPELFELWIEAHEEGCDWQGVIDIARIGISETKSTKYFARMGNAGLEQASILISSGDQQSAIDLLMRTGKELNQAFVGKKTTPFASPEIVTLRNQCFAIALRNSEILNTTRSSKIKVFDLGWRAFESFSRSNRLLRATVMAAASWAGYVKVFEGEFRGGDQRKFEETIDRLSRMLNVFEQKGWNDPELIDLTKRTLEMMISTRDELAAF